MRLTRRERLLAAGMAIFTAVWALYAFAIRPATERIETLNRVIPEKRAQLQHLRTKSSEYVMLRDKFTELKTQIGSSASGGLGHLEALINRSGLQQKVVQMRQHIARPDPEYYEAIVEIKLAGLTLAELVDLLSKVETGQAPAKVQTLHIRKNAANADLLDSVVEIHKAAPAGHETNGA